MGLDIATELTCDGTTPFAIPWAALGAPLSLFILIMIVVALLMIKRKRSGKNVCCSCCTCCFKDESQKKVVSTYTKYDADSDIEIQVRYCQNFSVLLLNLLE